MKLPLLKYYLSAPFSIKLRLYLKDNLLEKVSLEKNNRDGVECLFYANSDPCNPSLLNCVQSILSWIKTYLSKQQPQTQLPISLPLSDFSLLVLKTLQEIPLGNVVTYQELACLIGNPKAARAVGSALNKNPLPFIIPCHRVVSKKDSIGGFAYPLELKKLLLNFERS
jgi:O-6-methylguanine DNA methyltransferase